MKIHHLSVDDALASLHSGPEGLSGAEAGRRLQEFGPNRVERVAATPLGGRFARGVTHFFAVILWGEGDALPADCRVIQAFGARVNNATVTGESLPKARDERPSTEEDVIRSKNVLLAGTSLGWGEGRARGVGAG